MVIMKKINIFEFTRFTDEYEHSGHSWCDDMVNAGFKSAELVTKNYLNNTGREYYLSDKDYMWFILKWS
jgi:hypothetical protein